MQLDLLAEQSRHEACIALLRKALEVAFEDGTYDLLSSKARNLISQALLPPAGGVEAIIAGLQSDIDWTKALLDAYQPAIKRIAEMAAAVRASAGQPAQRPTYNCYGYVTPDIPADLATIAGALTSAAPKPGGE